MKQSIILLLLLTCLTISVHAFAAEVSMPAISVDPGALVQIPINVDNAAGLAAYQFVVTYNTAVLNCTNVLKGGLTQGWDTPTVNTSVPGQITFLSTEPNLAELPGGSGSLAILECAAGSTPGASTPLEFGQALLSDGSGNPVNATTVNGTFTINGGQCIPSAEVCDGIDNDCDGQVDEDLTRSTACGIGACAATGTETCTVGAWGNDSCIPGIPSAEACNNADDDCDGAVDDGIALIPIICGIGACASEGTLSCQNGQMAGICTPKTGSPETCNGIDDDCDSQIDNGIEPIPTTCGEGACVAVGELICQNGQMVDSCTPVVNAESCNGIDDDCDGQTDNGIEPIPTTCGVGACIRSGEQTCQNDKEFSPIRSGYWIDNCTPGPPQLEGPFGDPTCSDQIDNDCDGLSDAGDPDCVCISAEEMCDARDNDCDGLIDEDIEPVSATCGLGICAVTGTKTCQNGQWIENCIPGNPQLEGQVLIASTSRTIAPFGSLTCSDQIDNDCDGAIDTEDADCFDPKLPDLSQWVRKWFKLSANMQGCRFNLPDSTVSSDQFRGTGYMYFWRWSQDTGELNFDYYESTDQGTWDINTGKLDYFAGTDARFFFLYQGEGAHAVWSFTGEMTGKIKNGILYDGTIKTFGGYHIQVRDNKNTYSANEMKITGKLISDYEVPVPHGVRLTH